MTPGLERLDRLTTDDVFAPIERDRLGIVQTADVTVCKPEAGKRKTPTKMSSYADKAIFSGAGTMRKCLSHALAALTLSGCAAVGPNFHSPAPPTVTRYLSPGDSISSSSSQTIGLGEQVTAKWWMLFRSSELNELVRRAVADSPTLDSARARLAQAQNLVAQARAERSPQIGVAVSEAEEKQSSAAFGLPPKAFPLPSRYNLFQVGPTASYRLDFFGGVRREIEQRSAQADVQAYRLDAAYMALTGNVVTQALRVAALRAQVATVDDILAIDRQNARLVLREREVGEAPDPDVVVARSQVAADESLRPALAQQLSQSQHTLTVLVGRSPGDWSPPDFDLAALALPGRIPVSLPSALVRQRPDILAAEAQLHVDSAVVGVATAQLYPQITLSAGANASSLNAADLFSTSGLVWSVAAGVTQPVFDGGMRRAERRAALDSFRASAADYRQTVLTAFGQVADLLQALEHDADQLAGQQRSLDLATQSVDLQRIAYGRGAIGVLPLLDAQRQCHQARLGVLRAQAQRYQDTAALMVAMGGGWWGTDMTGPDRRDGR